MLGDVTISDPGTDPTTGLPYGYGGDPFAMPPSPDPGTYPYYSGDPSSLPSYQISMDPNIYAAELATGSPPNNGASAADIIKLMTAAIPVVTTAISQAQLLKIQQARAAQGLPPLNASQYGLGVSVGLSPQTMLLVGAGLVAVLILAKHK